MWIIAYSLSEEEENIVITLFETSSSWSGEKIYIFSGVWPFLPFNCIANCLFNIVKNWTKSRTTCVSYAISMGILLKRPLEKLFTQFDHFHDWYRLLQTGFQFKTELNLNLNFITRLGLNPGLMKCI